MTNLLFGVHMHQPVDNFSETIDKAVKMCYAPFFEMMSRYPKFRFSFHSSGWILQYIKRNYPDVFENIKKCNIEFFTGGFYEPILCSIDEKSSINQIKKLTGFIEKNFNQTPKGLWLTERVWSDSIIKAVKKCGIEYIIVDDTHIFKAHKKDIQGFWTTESNGEKVDLFAINKRLRYKIPFSTPQESVEIIKSFHTAVIFDDLEKFGLWPNTHEWVYKEKWLEDFINTTLKKVQTRHFRDYHQEHKSLGLVYLPNLSYDEMNEWADGRWKNFLTKYPESNRIHKRMLEFQDLQNNSLFKLQTNDVYWHGAFGGIYLPNLRDNAYRYIIECEQKYKKDDIVLKDTEILGYKQLKIKTKNLIMRFSQKGGSLIEFDDRNSLFNFQNTLTRCKEKYHNEITNSICKEDPKEVKTIHQLHFEVTDEVKKHFVFDKYEKVSFIDLLKDGNDIVENFANDIFQIKNNTFSIKNLKKKYTFTEDGFKFKNILNYEGRYTYVLELNLHFAHYDDLMLNEKVIKEEDEVLGKSFLFFDSYTQRKIILEFNHDMRLKYKLLKSVSRNEGGFELIIQGINLNFEVLFQNSLELKGKFLCQR